MTPKEKEIQEAINGTNEPTDLVRAFGVPTFDEGIEDIESMQDWDNEVHTEQGLG